MKLIFKTTMILCFVVLMASVSMAATYNFVVKTSSPEGIAPSGVSFVAGPFGQPGKPIAGAAVKVYLNQKEYSAVTDIKGIASITTVSSPDAYSSVEALSVRVGKVGYKGISFNWKSWINPPSKQWALVKLKKI